MLDDYLEYSYMFSFVRGHFIASNLYSTRCALTWLAWLEHHCEP